MALGACRSNIRCVLGGLSASLIGGRPGNLQTGPTDTRYLTSTEFYREWGVSADGRTFDRTGWVVWRYDQWRMNLPSKTVFGPFRAGDPQIDAGRTWTGMHSPPWPTFAVEAGKTTNIYQEAHIRGPSDPNGYGCREYNLDAKRAFTQPNTAASAYAKTRQMHTDRGAPAYMRDGDIVVGGRSLRANGFILNYWEGDQMHSIVGEDDPADPDTFPSSWSLLVPTAPVAGCWVHLPFAPTSPTRLVVEDGGLTAGLETDYYADMGGGYGAMHYPGVLIHWLSLPNSEPGEACPANYLWSPEGYSHVTPGVTFNTRRVAIDYEDPDLLGDDLLCEETTTTANEVVFDPAPSDALTGGGYREYVADGSCPP